MSLPTAEGTTYSASEGTVRERVLHWLNQHKFWLIVGSIVLAFLIFAIIRATSSPARSPLASDNPAPDGGMALAQILRQQGVEVIPTDTATATAKTLSAHQGDVTLMVYDPKGFLEASQLSSLKTAATTLVLVEPSPGTLIGLKSKISSGGAGPDSVTTSPAGCSDPAAQAAGSSEVGSPAGSSRLYHGPVTCFEVPGGTSGSYVTTADGTVKVMGNSAALSNDRLVSSGNAALALNALGEHHHLVWYVPSLADVPASDKPADIASVTPSWVSPAAIWLTVVAALALWWRGRRDGPLVMEPLPVSVRGSETAAGRARLYQDAQATQTAAENLRAATLQRLAKHFRLGSDASAAQVCSAVVRNSALPPAQVTHVLLEFSPETNAALLDWAHQLHTLESEATTR